MAQLQFSQNMNFLPGNSPAMVDGALSVWQWTPTDSVSLNTLQIVIQQTAAVSANFSFFLGLYTLTGSTLTIVNSASRSGANATSNGLYYISLVTSATSNITPIPMWWGLLYRSHSAVFALNGQNLINATNAFPGALIAGTLSVTTVGVPASIATTDLVTSGVAGSFAPYMIISA